MRRVRRRTFKKRDPLRHVSVAGKEPGQATQEAEEVMGERRRGEQRSRRRTAATSHVCGGHADDVTGARGREREGTSQKEARTWL